MHLGAPEVAFKEPANETPELQPPRSELTLTAVCVETRGTDEP